MPAAPTALAIDPTGSRITAASTDGTVRVYDLMSGLEVTSFTSRQGHAVAIAYDRDGTTHIALAEGSLRRLDLRAGTTMDRLDAKNISAVGWGPRNDYLATGSSEGIVRVWNAGTGVLAGSREGHDAWVRHVSWDPRGDRLASVANDGSIVLQNPRKAQLLHRWSDGDAPLRTCTWSADGRRIATAGDAGEVVIRLANSGAEVGRIDTGAPVTSIAWSPRDKEVIAVATHRELSLFDAKERIRLASLVGHEGPVRFVAWSDDGARLASVGDDRSLRVWDVDTGRPIVESTTHGAAATAVAFVNGGDQLVTTSIDDMLRLFDAATGDEVALLGGGEDATAIAVAPEGMAFAVAAPDGVSIQDARNGVESVRLAGRSARAVFDELLEPRFFDRLDNLVQSGVAMGVGLTADPDAADAVETLLDKRKRDRSISRAYLALSLGRVGDVERGDELIRLLKDKDVQVRRSSANGLGVLLAGTGDINALKALSRQEKKESDQVTEAFIGLAMARIGGSEATKTLYPKVIESRKSGLPGVIGPPRISLGGLGREQFAALSLGLIGNSNVSPTLLSRLKQTGDHSIQGANAIALGLIGDQRTAPDLHKLLRKTSDPILRGNLAVALGLLRFPPAADDIEEFVLEENHIELLPDAAVGLALIDRPRAISVVLSRLAQDDSSNVQRALFYALGQIGDASAAPAAIDTLTGRATAYIREYAAVALGDLADRTRLAKLARVRADSNYPAETELLLIGSLYPFL